MRIMLWGGRSKARILIDMISEIYPTKAEIIGIFDETLDELSFCLLYTSDAADE